MDSNQSPGMTGRVELRGLRCTGRHGESGVGPPERAFVADVSIELDLTAVAKSDAYSDVVDLADLAATVREVIGGPARLLLETVVVHAAQRIMERFPPVRQVHLRLARPEPPGLDAAEEAVELALARGAE